MALRDFTVFIVDDDQGVLDALSALVQEAGYETKAYTSPRAFLDERSVDARLRCARPVNAPHEWAGVSA